MDFVLKGPKIKTLILLLVLIATSSYSFDVIFDPTTSNFKGVNINGGVKSPNEGRYNETDAQLDVCLSSEKADKIINLDQCIHACKQDRVIKDCSFSLCESICLAKFYEPKD